MKKLFAIVSLLAISLVSMAQNQIFYEWKDGVVRFRSVSEMDSLAFSLPNDIVSVTEDSLPEVGATHARLYFSTYSAFTFAYISNSANTEMGVCYSSLNSNPTVADANKIISGRMSKGDWMVTIMNLSKSSTYYYRPYVQIYNQVYYGEVNTFTTLQENPDTDEDLWVSLGMGKFMEAFFYDDKTYFDVEIQQNYNEPNRFRVVDPYVGILGSIPVDKYLEFAILPKGFDFNGITLDAEYVVFNDYNMGQWNSNYAEDIYALHPYRFGRTSDKWTFNVVLDYQENGLPGEVSLAPIFYLFEQGGGWDQSTANTISILFPGYRKRDYSSSVEFEGTFKEENGTTYAVGNLTLGGDATDVKAVVMPADADAKAVADAIAAGELQATDVSSGRIEVPFDAEELGSEKLQIIVAVIANNVVKSFDNASFEYYGEGGNPWKSLGTGYYTDDVILPLFYNHAPLTYEVEILEHSENPGLYRIMNPYAKSVHPAGDDDYAPEGMYIEVNATDAEGVYIQQQSLGMDWGYGEMSLVSYGATYFSNYPFETVKGAGYLGKVVDGVITFPTFFHSDDTSLQGILYMGSDVYLAGMNGKMEIVLPGSNAFARNMAVAKAKTTQRTALKKSFSGVKVDVKMKKLFLDSNIEKMEIVKF